MPQAGQFLMQNLGQITLQNNSQGLLAHFLFMLIKNDGKIVSSIIR